MAKKWEEGSTVKDNQRRMVANTLRAGNKLTPAQKKQFTASEITAIKGELVKETPHQKRMRKPSGVASKPKAGKGGPKLSKTFGTRSRYGGLTKTPVRKRKGGSTGTTAGQRRRARIAKIPK